MVQAAKHFRALEEAARLALGAGTLVQHTFGAGAMPRLTEALAKLRPGFWQWSRHIGRAPQRPHREPARAEIVYFPSCVTRIMGSCASDDGDEMHTILRIAQRAGIAMYLPKDAKGLCCSQPFAHLGYPEAQRIMANRVVEALYRWSDGGRLPIMCDVTSCARTLMLELECETWGTRPRVLSPGNEAKYKKLRFMDVAEWLHDEALPKLDVVRPKRSVLMHPTCACRQLCLEPKIEAIGRACAAESYTPASAGCCGAGGDRGFRYPEGTASALRDERAEIEGRSFDGAYTFAKTCAIVLSDRLPAAFESIAALVDETTVPRAPRKGNGAAG